MAEGEGIEPPAALKATANGVEVRKAHQSLSTSEVCIPILKLKTRLSFKVGVSPPVQHRLHPVWI